MSWRNMVFNILFKVTLEFLKYLFHVVLTRRVSGQSYFVIKDKEKHKH